MSTIRPTGITADRNLKTLNISWSDGHNSIIPFALLRYACPCAECRGGHDGMRSTPDPEVFERELVDNPSTRLKNIEPVGSYGMTVLWEDGHHYGIYNWEYLRLLG